MPWAAKKRLRRIKEQIPKVRDQVTDLDEQWQDHTLTFRFQAMGFKVGGTLAVEDTAANLDLDLPLVLMMAKGKIEEGVRQELGVVSGETGTRRVLAACVE